jgi:outer membrane protein
VQTHSTLGFAVSNLYVHNNFGFLVQGGVEYELNSRWSLFTDFKYVWLSVDADGFVGSAPVAAHVKLNPSLISAGFKYHY